MIAAIRYCIVAARYDLALLIYYGKTIFISSIKMLMLIGIDLNQYKLANVS